MTLFPLEAEELKIRSFPAAAQNQFTLDYAMKRDVTSLLAEQIESYSELEKGQVINIYGNDKTGKTTVVKSLSQIITQQTDYSICVTFDFEEAHRELEENDIIIIEPGEIIKSYQDKSDTYGLEQIRNACNNKKAIALIVSDKKLIDKENRADFYLKTELFDKDQETNTCILEIDSFCVGYVEIYKLEPEYINEAYAEAKEEFLKNEVDRLIENIQETTKEVIKRWLKRKEIIFAEDPKTIDPEDPAIILCNVIILGGQGDGKSTLSKILVKLDIDYYGEKHVHALRHEREISNMIRNGFSEDLEKYIQDFIADDFTFTDSKLTDLQDFTKVRHYMCTQSGITQGLGRLILNQHYLTGKASPVVYRNVIDFLFVLNASDHDYTRNTVLAKLMPESHIQFLDHIRDRREEAELNGNAKEYLKLKGFSVCVIKGRSYPFYMNRKNFPIAKIESFEPGSFVSSIPDLEKLHLRTVDNQFLEILRNELFNIIVNRIPGINQKHLSWFIDYYASEEQFSFKEIAEIQTDQEYTDNAIGKAVRALKKQIDNTTLGICLESALEIYPESTI